MKKIAKVSIEQILYIFYKICRAYIIWYQEQDDKKWYDAHSDTTDYMKVPK